MKCTNPSDSNKQDIATQLQETLQNRRDWIIKKSPTISQILYEYPRLLDYNGEMVRIIFVSFFYICKLCLSFKLFNFHYNFLQINNEFRYFFKEKSVNFLARFPSYYCPRILEYAKLNRLDVYNRVKNIADGKINLKSTEIYLFNLLFILNF